MNKSRAYTQFKNTLINGQYICRNIIDTGKSKEAPKIEIWDGEKGRVLLMDYGINGADVFIQASKSNEIDVTNKALQKAV